jgi:hypothetical protein
MLLRDIFVVCCENQGKVINTLCGEKAEFYYVESGCRDDDEWALYV